MAITAEHGCPNRSMQRLANEHCSVIFSTVLALRFRGKKGSEQGVYKRNEQKSTGCGTFDRTLPLACVSHETV